MSIAVLSPLNMLELDCYCDDDSAADTLLPMEVIQDSSSNDDSSTSVPSLSDDDVEMDDIEDSVTLSRDGVVVSQSYGGLRNLGNTCYMNSGLQMMASLDKFNTYLEEAIPEGQCEEKLQLRQEYLTVMKKLQSEKKVHPEAFKKVLDTRSHLFVGYRQQDCHEFTTTLLDLLSEDYKLNSIIDDLEDENRTCKDQQVILGISDQILPLEAALPQCALQGLPSFSALDVDDISKLLHGNSEKECESITHGAVTKEQSPCKLVGGRAVVSTNDLVFSTVDEHSISSIHTSTNDEHSENIEAAEPSLVEDYFATEVRVRLTCNSCKYSRCQSEKFLCLSIDITSEIASLEEGLRKFFSPEKRDIKCEKCFSEVGATSTMEITKLPQAILFHFKRFIVDVSPDYSRITYRKNHSQVDFPERISLDDIDGVLAEFLAPDVNFPERSSTIMTPMIVDEDSTCHEDLRRYEIRSVVNHMGSSASCGHYTADSNRLYPNGERNWTRFNDSLVSTSLNKCDAMGTSAKKTAYMVMYELV